MRAPVLLAALGLATLGFATPGFAQVYSPSPISPHDPGLAALQEMQRQQMVQQQNQLSSLDAQIRAQQAIADIQAQKVSPRLTPPYAGRGSLLPQIDASQLASIPESALADSNKKVLDAAARR